MIVSPPGVLSRRALLGTLASSGLSVGARADAPDNKLRAIAFDAFPIFDPRLIATRARTLYPDKGEALASAWTTKLFATTWIVTSAEHYIDFSTLADAALSYAADSVELDLSLANRDTLLGTFARLEPWPDVLPALKHLRRSGVRLVFLSNLGEATLRASTRHAGLEAYFEPPLSTDHVRRFKPAPESYAMAMHALGLPKEAIGFAAFGGWDALGASWFGYRTVWVNRLGLPKERLEPGPQIVSHDMSGVLRLAGL